MYRHVRIYILIYQLYQLGKGLVLGAVFSIVNFIVMGEALPMRIGKSRKKTIVISAGSIFVRYFLLTIPLVLAINFEQFNLFSVIIGIFSRLTAMNIAMFLIPGTAIR